VNERCALAAVRQADFRPQLGPLARRPLSVLGRRDRPQDPIEWVFRPKFWVNATRFRECDLIRIVAKDGSYDFRAKVSVTITVNRKPRKQEARISIFAGFGKNLPQYVIDAEASVSKMPDART
jgi:hypothetical protein